MRRADWDPGRDSRGPWIHSVVSKHRELTLCELDCGELVTPLVALKVADEWLAVHLERTRCEHCQEVIGICAVPDFGVGTERYRELVSASCLRVQCGHCQGRIQRRIVLWRCDE